MSIIENNVDYYKGYKDGYTEGLSKGLEMLCKEFKLMNTTTLTINPEEYVNVGIKHSHRKPIQPEIPDEPVFVKYR